MELVMADACKRASAGRITAVIHIMDMLGKTEKLYKWAPITTKYADILTTSGVSRVLTMGYMQDKLVFLMFL